MYRGDVSTQVNPRNLYNFINIAHKILLYMCPKLNIPVFINWGKKKNMLTSIRNNNGKGVIIPLSLSKR
jgi:hypothetical protein